MEHSPLTQTQLDALARQLHSALDALQGDAVRRHDGLSQAEFALQTRQDDADDASQLSASHEVDATCAEIDSQEMRDIRSALERLQHADFGLCAECNMPIALARLMVAPQARRCEMCETRQELRRT